jgi:hypothetical protein
MMVVPVWVVVKTAQNDLQISIKFGEKLTTILICRHIFQHTNSKDCSNSSLILLWFLNNL